MFESWGRISTVIGSKQLYSFSQLKEAEKKFWSTYWEKTGNSFCFHTMKRSRKFYHLNVESQPTLIESNLPNRVLKLMKMLFNVEKMENLTSSCDLDLKRMPLGRITNDQIKLGISVLIKIDKLIQQNGSQGELCRASNKFYTMIPHSFGIERPPIIDTIEKVNEKNELLEKLLDMEIIYSFVEGENGKKINPYDSCYSKLKISIMPLGKNSSSYETLCNVVKDTHSSIHDRYGLEVLDIFCVEREGEKERFQAYKNLSNHQLLWHGSRLTNFVSILTNGLKIAPPNVPRNSSYFGDGIYFADVVSKAANYCRTTEKDCEGLLLLCEVALGKSQIMYSRNTITDLPNEQYQSIKGIGSHYPTEHREIDGVRINSNLVTSYNLHWLIHNEYVVYDPSQVEIKYLLKVKFNYK